MQSKQIHEWHRSRAVETWSGHQVLCACPLNFEHKNPLKVKCIFAATTLYSILGATFALVNIDGDSVSEKMRAEMTLAFPLGL